MLAILVKSVVYGLTGAAGAIVGFVIALWAFTNWG
ncbi:membrane protein [Streptomyces phage TunaTartare]|jgi:hypothetical protein|uniref:Membrane protein n=1 Tax=Streptomyces phage TunaTartare TaxID=2848887 RepID=A0A8F2E754_9CAUD|nr:membrane protein [Streptomyces phage TunaTartare]QWT30088.1 membrane protein [Streptomyces phage TunaTartare]